VIRPFKPEDASFCSALIVDCLKNDPAYNPSLLLKAIRNETAQVMRDRASVHYIAVYETEGQIRGVAGLHMNEIRLLYVSPGYQRRGVGRDLLLHLTDMIPGALFPDVFVYTTKQAVAFYRACGFRNRGPFLFDLEGEKLQTEFMTLPITDRGHCNYNH
jgi:GNAT superfamily N-acetyltransferase